MPIFSRIVGTGMAVPDRVLTNHDLERMVDTSDEWIRSRTGMVERRIADESIASSDLGADSAKRALEAAGIQAEAIDLLIVATITPDMAFPSTACCVQRALGVRGAAAFDLAAACSGFVYALAVADGMIRAGHVRRALVVGADVITRLVNWSDRNSCVLFGDGAGAVVLVADERPGMLAFDLGADGAQGDLLNVPGGGSRMPATREVIERKLNTIHIDGPAVYKHAVRVMSDSIMRACERAGVSIRDIHKLVPHQANIRIIQDVGKRIGINGEHVEINVDRYGNTSAATIPIALDEAVRGGRIREGDLVGLVSFGGGLTWASAVLRW